MGQLGFFDLPDHLKRLSEAGDPLEEMAQVDTPINLATGRAVVTEVMREGGLAVYGDQCPVSVASLGGLEVG